MDAIIQPSGPLRGALSVPADKAIVHRAILLAALAEGRTEIRPWPDAEDCQRTLAVVQGCGVRAQRSSTTMVIEGVGRAGLTSPSAPLQCGESGTTLRLAAGVLAGQPFTSRLVAGPGLSRRPMRRIAEPLIRMGAQVEGAASPANPGELCPPLAIRGRRPLTAMRYELPVASAQVKSAVLLAGLFADGVTTVIEPAPTRDHTERMLRAFTIVVRTDGHAISVEPGVPVSPGAVAIPGDCSSAAFFVVAACCVAGSAVTLTDVGLNPSRTAFLAVLRRMGAQVTMTEQREAAGEPRGVIGVSAGPLRGVTVEAAEVPGLIDELPILMVAAACAQGTSRFRGVGELRVKETDRIRSMVDGLQRLGVAIRVSAPDTVEIEGGPMAGAIVSSAGDHRTAMSLAVAGLAAGGPTTIQGAECVAKSFPDFFERLASLSGSPTRKAVDKGTAGCV